MSQTPKFLEVGVIRQYEYKGDNGDIVQRFEVELKEKVDIYFEGRKVDFKRKDVGDKVYFSKKISARPVEDEIARINSNPKLDAETRASMAERLKKRGAIFVLTIPPNNQQQ
jgi:hypothetical protein